MKTVLYQMDNDKILVNELFYFPTLDQALKLLYKILYIKNFDIDKKLNNKYR